MLYGKQFYMRINRYNQADFIFQSEHMQTRINDCPKRQVNIAWVPPCEGSYKVSIDGSHSKAGISSCGGLVCNSYGSMIHGFYCKVGAGNALWAKLWGLRMGIKLAQHLNLRNVVFEMDSKSIVEMIASGGTNNGYL